MFSVPLKESGDNNILVKEERLLEGEIIIKIFKAISDFFRLNQLKGRILGIDEQGLTEEEILYLNRTKPQNPFGMIVLFGGAFSFICGIALSFIFVPIMTLIICFLTFGTFDKEKEDNPWTFYLGFCLTLIGLIINIFRIHIQIVV